MKSIEEKVDSLISPQKSRRRRGIGKSKKMTVGIFAVLIVGTLIASGALLSYYGSIETTATISQSVRLDGMFYSTGHADITIKNDLGTFVAGCCEWGGCHNLHLHSLACDPTSVKVSSIVSPVDGGLTTMIAAEVQGTGADFSDYETPTGTLITGTNIQSAIDSASSSAVIVVPAGTYSGNVNINKDITLVAQYAPDSGSSATISGTVILSASDSTIKGFNVVPGSVTGNKGAIQVLAGSTTVDSNIVSGMTGDGTGTIKGIHIYSDGPSDYSGITISNNLVENIGNTGSSTAYSGSDGIMVQGLVSTVNVVGNTVKDINSFGWAYGIEVTPTGTDVPKTVSITKNNMESISATTWSGVGFSVDESSSATADASKITFTENNFFDTPIDIINKDTVNTLIAYDNWFGCDGIQVYGEVDATWNTWAHDDLIILDPDETVYFMIQYCTPDNAVGDYTSTVEFLPYP